MATKPKPKATFFLTEIKRPKSSSLEILSRKCVYGPLREADLFGPAHLYLVMELNYADYQKSEISTLEKKYEVFHERPARKATKSKHSWGNLVSRPYKGNLAAFMEEFTRAEAELAALIPQSL